MMAAYGGEMVAASTAKSSQKYSAIMLTAEGSLSAFASDNLTGTWTGITLPAGFTILGDITGFTASVPVVAYHSGEKH